MKKLFLSSVLVLVALNINAKTWKTIRIATEGAFPPFNAINKDGQVEGLEVDFANALCAAAKVKCTIVTQDWDGIIPGLLAKKYDAIIASLSITDERKKSIAFSNPYYITGNSFVAKKGAFSDTSPKSLAGKKIGFQKATISENFVRDNYKQSETKSYVKVEDAFLDLASGRLDLVFNDTLSSYGSFLDLPEGKGYAVNGPEYTDRKWFGDGIGIGIRQKEPDLAKILNKAIDQLYKTGEFKKISEKWLPGIDISVK